MDEYIKREALYEKAYWHGEHPDVGNPFPDGVDAIDIEDVDAIPAADVAPVRHGKWEPVLEGVWNLPTPVLVGWRCSQCGRTEQEKEPYCNCGAKMDGECDA